LNGWKTGLFVNFDKFPSHYGSGFKRAKSMHNTGSSVADPDPMFLSLPDPDPDPLVRGMDPDPFINMQK
jgi:hypothetical protein